MLVNITPAAADKVKQLLASRGETSLFLKIQVMGGGCSGLQYNMDFIPTPPDGDQVIEQDGVRICVDPRSALYLAGTVLDYSDALMGGGFKLQNPNATSTCGCGESFSV